MFLPPSISYIILVIMMMAVWFVYRRINNPVIVEFGRE